MGELGAFLKITRVPAPERDPRERVGDYKEIYQVLTGSGGWTLLTAVNLMLFSLLHNPCSTTILTIYHETKSKKWTAVATLLPLALGFIVCFMTATIARLFGWI